MTHAEFDQLCSTPFGISDEDTPTGQYIYSAVARAQRLSASVMKTPMMIKDYNDKEVLCSTPFGISDEDTLIFTGLWI